MADASGKHVKQDRELLERYALGHLDDSAAGEIAEHIQRCPECRSAVEHERLLAAGAKRLGRDMLKQRIDERLLRDIAVFRVPWAHVVGVAAVLVIMVGVALFSRWYPFSTPPTEGIDEEKAALLERKDTAVSQPTSPSPSYTARDTASETRRYRLDAAREVSAPRSAPLSAIGDASGAGAKAEDHLSMPTLSLAVPGSVWLEGRVLPTEIETGEAMSARRELRREREKRPTAGGLRQQLVVTQKPGAQLAPAQQTAIKDKKVETILAFLEPSAAGATLTLYLDPPAADADFSSAQVQAIGNDSIVVVLGNRRIGYKLPAEWGAITKMEVRRAR